MAKHETCEQINKTTGRNDATMPRFLREDECLVRDGTANLRGPGGKLLEAVPQYVIVPAATADPAEVVQVEESERLVAVGLRTLPGHKEAALERYEAGRLAGVRPSLPEGGTETLYIRVAATDLNAKTGLFAERGGRLP